jgi:hypothetical protein
MTLRTGILAVCLLLGGTTALRAQSADAGVACGSFTDLGLGTAGGFDLTPILVGAGSLCAGESIMLSMSLAAKSSNAYFVIGLAQGNAPFKGGVMVPSPDLVIFGIQTRKGMVMLPGTWPAGVSFPIYFQFWVQDSAGPAGYSASNGLVATPGA